MKKFLFVSYLIISGLVMLLASCSEQHNLHYLKPTENIDDIKVNYTYNWEKDIKGDTMIYTCNQVIFLDREDNPLTFYPKTIVKLYWEKKDVTFASSEEVAPKLKQQSSTSNTSGFQPNIRTTTNIFNFSDGNNAFMEITLETYQGINNGQVITLPYMNIKDLSFRSCRITTTSSTEKTYQVTGTFSFKAEKISTPIDSLAKQETLELSSTYNKRQLKEDDKIVSTFYEQGYNWLSENTFQLYVDEVNTYSISGVKTSRHTSPILTFNLTKGADKSYEVTSFDYTGTLKTEQDKKETSNASNWTIKSGLVKQNIYFTNGKTEEDFSNNFTYPAFDASYTTGLKTFDFDLSVRFSENYKFSNAKGTSSTCVTNASATFLGKTFSQTVTTSFSKKVPEQQTDENRKFGKILNYSVTAILDKNGINSSTEITKKCIVIEYENGYEWGISAYNEDFPQSFTYTEKVYAGLNSASQSTTSSEYQLAQAKDVSSGIEWVDGLGNLLAAIDNVSCKVYGWKNIENSRYSAFITGYKALLTKDHYQLALTAPSGVSKVFKSYP